MLEKRSEIRIFRLRLIVVVVSVAMSVPCGFLSLRSRD